jgi:hypothetical protein
MPATARRLPDGDIAIPVNELLALFVTALVGIFELVLVVVRFPELSAT